MLEEFYLPEIKSEKVTENHFKFVIEPLCPGYGVTIGNALRRVLLSSLPGTAVTAIKIKGAPHEFSTLPGVKEDLVEIILNLKSLSLRLYTDKPETLTLKVKGKEKIKASDIKASSNVEIINKDLHIATLDSSKAELDMEIKVEKGRGYVPTEALESEKIEVGTIAVDAIYTPATKVSYNIENTRVGKITNLDRLTLEITTDGSITPQESLEQASKILVDHFSLFLGKKVSAPKPKSEKPVKEKEEKISVEELDFSSRTVNALLANKITTVKKLTRLTENNLLELKGLGSVGVEEIKDKLAKMGMSFKGNK